MEKFHYERPSLNRKNEIINFLDEFVKYKSAINGSGDVPESEKLTDTFYLFVNNLNEIKAKCVKKVIIDDSLNGGGYVTILGKLLALMSKNNYSEMYIRNDGNGAIQKITTRVDSNKDGVFDENDCYGNDLEFYIVTSNYSFSCGNAFPFYAQAYGYAKIIGNRCGGGECCVFSYSFPTGQGLSYSSPYHIGYFNKETKVFTGDEAGVNPKYPIADPFFNIYNVDIVSQRIEYCDSLPPLI